MERDSESGQPEWTVNIHHICYMSLILQDFLPLSMSPSTKPYSAQMSAFRSEEEVSSSITKECFMSGVTERKLKSQEDGRSLMFSQTNIVTPLNKCHLCSFQIAFLKFANVKLKGPSPLLCWVSEVFFPLPEFRMTFLFCWPQGSYHRQSYLSCIHI